MSPTTHDNIEAGVRELFDRQAEAMTVSERTWDDAPIANVTQLKDHRARRRVLGGGLAAVATAAIAAAVLAVVGVGGNTTHVTTKNPPVQQQPDGGVPVHFQTPQVDFSATDLSIVAGGKTFTSSGAKVGLHSDPGDAKYQTLELSWNEHGVVMLMNIYFAADEHNWWATEIRTYNGKGGDGAGWIEYRGNRFTTPLGSAFTGNVDLTPTDGQAGHLSIGNLRLEAFRRPAACNGATSKYVLSPNYDPVDFTGGISAAFLDATTCRPVADVTPFTFTYSSADPTIATIVADPINDPTCSTCPEHGDVALHTAGDTTGTVIAKDKRTGAVVATAHFRVHSSGA